MRYSLVTDGRTDSGVLVIGSRFTVRNPKKASFNFHSFFNQVIYKIAVLE